MNIDVDDYNIDPAFLSSDYYLNGENKIEQDPIEDVELFFDNANWCDWSYVKKNWGGEDDVIEGKWESFFEWAKHRMTSDDVKAYLEFKNRIV